MKKRIILIYFLIFNLFQLTNFACLNSQDILENIIDSAIAKNLATSLNQSNLDPNINYLNYQRNLKKDLFPDSVKLSDIQNQALTKLSKDSFSSILTSYNKAKQMLLNKPKETSIIIKELNNMINYIAKIISINAMFEEFSKAGVFKEFEKIKEIKEFLESLNKQKSDIQKSDESVESNIENIIILAAAGIGLAIPAVFYAKFFKSGIINEITYDALRKSFINSDVIKFNEILHDLIKKSADKSKSLISFEEVFNKVENNLIKEKISQDFINRIRILNDLPIKNNSELFKTLEKKLSANEDVENITFEWEKEYQEALIKKNPKAIADLIENIIETAKISNKKIEPTEIINLMKEHSDFAKVFSQDIIRTQILKKFNLTDLSSKLNLDTIQLESLKTNLSKLPKESYIKINDTYYKLASDSQLHEIINPTRDITRIAHEIDLSHHISK